MAFDQKQFEKIFYSDGFQLGMNVCKSGFDQRVLLESIKNMYEIIDTFLQMFEEFAGLHGKQPACKKGCEWCCHQPVYAMDYELDYLTEYVKASFDKKTQEQIAQKSENKRNAFRNLTTEKLLIAKHPCPLLENGACIAYQARPVACRIYLSSNLNSCLRFFQQSAHPESIPELMKLPLQLGKMINEGFKAALKTGGIVPLEFRIEEKLF